MACPHIGNGGGLFQFPTGDHMAATIKATCPPCGEVKLTPAALALVVYEPVAGSFYSFTCPKCAERITKSADARVIALLESGGVRALHLALEVRIPGPRISEDDLIEFGLEIEAL